MPTVIIIRLMRMVRVEWIFFLAHGRPALEQQSHNQAILIPRAYWNGYDK